VDGTYSPISIQLLFSILYILISIDCKDLAFMNNK